MPPQAEKETKTENPLFLYGLSVLGIAAIIYAFTVYFSQ
jgi:hypothetical protein